MQGGLVSIFFFVFVQNRTECAVGGVLPEPQDCVLTAHARLLSWREECTVDLGTIGTRESRFPYTKVSSKVKRRDSF